MRVHRLKVPEPEAGAGVGARAVQTSEGSRR